MELLLISLYRYPCDEYMHIVVRWQNDIVQSFLPNGHHGVVSIQDNKLRIALFGGGLMIAMLNSFNPSDDTLLFLAIWK